MIITSWNVNSLNVRLSHVLQYLQDEAPDILGLQELKQTNEAVNMVAFTEAGYHYAIFGQKTYNGVALLAKEPLQDIVNGIPNFDDEQARAIAASVGNVRVLNLYVPNGKAVGDEKYTYKLQWLTAVTAYIETLRREHDNLVIMGDFNIAPDDLDVHDPEKWRDAILCSQPERQALHDILALGFIDAYRHCYPQEQQFSWWDYRMGGLRRNIGLRIDLNLCSTALTVQDAGVHMAPRRWERPSDHAPAWVKIDV
ncbi:MAG: exodeoxyribonuclease III [Cardiobacteriaceae bacterium]|nr:exodeoxyribonuclease III [Cardiobacteriaceae bacterium]